MVLKEWYTEMFKELFLSTIISMSLSLKTSNDETKPYDYELMIQAQKDDKNLSYFIKRDWERELGEKYINNIFKIKYVNSNNIYYGLDLMDKESKDMEYSTINSGYKFPLGIQVGLSLKNEDDDLDALAHISYDNIIKKNNTDYILSLSIKSDFANNNIINTSADIKTWITDNINLFFLAKNIYYSDKEDFQFKVGLGFKL